MLCMLITCSRLLAWLQYKGVEYSNWHMKIGGQPLKRLLREGVKSPILADAQSLTGKGSAACWMWSCDPLHCSTAVRAETGEGSSCACPFVSHCSAAHREVPQVWLLQGVVCKCL